MLTTFLFTVTVSQLAVAQNTLEPQVTQGAVAGSCPLHSLRDAARQNLSRFATSYFAAKILIHVAMDSGLALPTSI